MDRKFTWEGDVHNCSEWVNREDPAQRGVGGQAELLPGLNEGLFSTGFPVEFSEALPPSLQALTAELPCALGKGDSFNYYKKVGGEKENIRANPKLKDVYKIHMTSTPQNASAGHNKESLRNCHCQEDTMYVD